MCPTAADPVSTPLVPPHVERLTPYQAGKSLEALERELGITHACKIGSNENPLGPSPRALAAATAALAGLHRYPDPSGASLRAALAVHHGVDADEVVLGSGSGELITLLVRTFCTSGSDDEVLTLEPSFPLYRIEAAAHGVRHTAVPLDADFRCDVDALIAAVTPETRLCFVCNPNNPTGGYLSRPELERLLTGLPAHVLLVIDEAYLEYAGAPDFPDAMTLRGLRDRLVILRTFSKAYGLAGLRVGYLVAPREIAGYVQRLRQVFNVNSIGYAAALEALRDTAHLARTRRVNRRGMALLERGLRRLGLRYFPSQANFLLVELESDAQPIYQALLHQGVIVRPVIGPRFLRISIGLEEENRRLLTALEALLPPARTEALGGSAHPVTRRKGRKVPARHAAPRGEDGLSSLLAAG